MTRPDQGGHPDAQAAVTPIRRERPDHIDTLRRLAIHDPAAPGTVREAEISPRDAALARFAATIATGGSDASFAVATDDAISAHLTVPELVNVLVDVTPIIGLPRAVTAAQHLAVVLGLGDDIAGEGALP